MAQQILRTEDIVEILDNRIIATSDHLEFDIRASRVAFVPAAVDILTGIITAANILTEGDIGKFETNSELPRGLSPESFYYVRNPSSSAFQVSETLTGAIFIPSSQGSGTHAFAPKVSYGRRLIPKKPSFSFGTDSIVEYPSGHFTLIALENTFSEGFAGKFTTTGTLPSGLSLDTTYYVSSPTPFDFQVSAAPSGSIVELLDAGTGTHTFTLDTYHPALLDKLLLQSPSGEQKAAIDAASSIPDSGNPVVLKDAIEEYYRQEDLGEFKDSVATYADLLLLTGNVVGDMRPVIAEQQIYRWNGTAWVLFVKTGTLDHTQLGNDNGNADYQHVSLADKSVIANLSNTHVHPNSLAADSFTQVWTYSETVLTAKSLFDVSPNIITDDSLPYILQVLRKEAGASFYVEVYNYIIYSDHQIQFLATIGVGTEIIVKLLKVRSDPDTILKDLASAGSGIIISNTERALIPTNGGIQWEYEETTEEAKALFDVSPNTFSSDLLIITQIFKKEIGELGATEVTDYEKLDNHQVRLTTSAGIGAEVTILERTTSDQKGAMNGKALIFPAGSVHGSSGFLTVSCANTMVSGYKGKFLTTGTLPQGLTAASFYYVRNPEAGSFQISLTLSGSLIPFIDGGSGIHTFGANLPSVANRYVTSVDPRLNTIKNPYVTFGLVDTDATFECLGSGTSVQVLQNTFDFISSPEALGLKAIEVLPSALVWEWGETVSNPAGKTIFNVKEHVANPDLYSFGSETANATQVWYNDTPVFENIHYTKKSAYEIQFLQLVPYDVRIIIREKRAYSLISGTVSWETGELPNTDIWPTNSYGAEVGSPVFSSPPDDSFLVEALALHESFFIFAPATSGSTAFTVTGTYEGTGFIRGITFVLGGTESLCTLLDRPGLIFEDCTFITQGSKTTLDNLKAMRITANSCHVIRCIFSGVYVSGIEVLGDDCVIDGCMFRMYNSTFPALRVSGNGCKVFGSNFGKGKIVIDAGVQDTVLDRNILSPDLTSVEDLGLNTRWLGSLAQDFQQAYIGRTRTVGTEGSYADFRGDTEAPFLEALADPYTSEVEVFEGSYVFASAVTIPPGKTVKAIVKGEVLVTGGRCFILSDSSRLSGINIISSGSLPSVFTSGTSGAKVSDSSFSTGVSFAIEAATTSSFSVLGCSFSGNYGLQLSGSQKARVRGNRFGNTSVATLSLSTSDLHYADNIETGGGCFLNAEDSVIYGNHFLDSLPTKRNTVRSLWWGNWPEEANNRDGIDTLELPVIDLMSPITTTGSYRGTFLGTAALAFIETGAPTASMMPMKMGARINRATGYTVSLSWVSALFSGSVVWEVTISFRDRNNREIGSGVPRTAIVARNPHLSSRSEEVCTFTFNISDPVYPYGVDDMGSHLLDISHVSATIRRLGDSSSDTLAGIAYLTNAFITLSRD